jgi:hypothetical protein
MMNFLKFALMPLKTVYFLSENNFSILYLNSY